MLKIAIIGAGYWGPNLIRTFSKINNVDIKYIADIQKGRRDLLSENYPRINIIDNVEQIFEDNEIEIVIIATPVPNHFSLGKQSLKSGKHTFIEKPLASSALEAQELVNISNDLDLKLGVGHIFTFHPGIEAIKEFTETNKIFKPYYFISNRANLRPPKSKVDVIWDLAVHDFSIINYLISDFPCTISAFAKDYSNGGNYDMAIINLKYPNDFSAIVHVGWHTSDKVRRFDLYGNKLSIFFDDNNKRKVKIFDEGIDNRVNMKNNSKEKLFYKSGTIFEPKLKSVQPLYNECISFVKSVINNEVFRNHGVQGYWAVKMCELSVQSIKTGKEIIIDE